MATTRRTRFDEDNLATFGIALRQAREDAGLTQAQLAAAIGRTQTLIGGWEAGQTEPHPLDVFTIETELGLDRGHLARTLGFLPLSPDTPRCDIVQAIIDSDLDAVDKQALLGVYKALSG